MAIERNELRLGAFMLVRNLTRLFVYIRGHYLLLSSCIVFSMIQASIEMSLPLIVRRGLDLYVLPHHAGAQAGDAVSGVLALAALYAGLLVANLGVSYAAALGLNHLGQTAVLRLRDRLWRHLHELPVRYFDENPVGRLVTRVTNDCATLTDMFSSVLVSSLSDVIFFAGVLVIMARLDGFLTLRLVFIAPGLVAATALFQAYSKRIYRIVRVQVARINTYINESLNGASVLKAFVREQHTHERFAELNRDYYRTQMRVAHMFAIYRPLVDFFAVAAMALVIWLGGARVLGSQMSVGTFVAFLLYVRLLFNPIQDLAEKLNILQSSAVASERLLAILDTPAEPTGPQRQGAAPGTGIVFDHVSFAYEPGVPVLHDVSFTVPAGKMVAVVGPTGSGKTTLASLLMRFYELGCNDGDIRIDGTTLREWDIEALRGKFSTVQQDVLLFAGTLARNVQLFGRRDVGRLARAIETSHLDRVVQRLPRGLEHELNERGTTLSQGERQLVAFARALAHSGEILILDEATASIDSQTEALIQEAMHTLAAGRTSLVIAHRLSTVQEADLIVVLNRGRIVEQGRHEELLRSGGLYAHLYATQFARG